MKNTIIRSVVAIAMFVAAIGAHAENIVVELHLPTMNCAMCPITVKKALEKVDGVLSADVSYKTKRAVIRFENRKTTVQELIQATTDAGYPSTLVETILNEP